MNVVLILAGGIGSRMKQEWIKFKDYANLKIVLYGIGRKIASLLEYNDCFDSTGLLVRETNNIGKNIYGLQVLSLSQAEKM